MIWESRKWRLITRVLALLVVSVLMLIFAGPVSYALQDDTPKQIADSGQLYDAKGQPYADRYIYVQVTPDINRAVTTGEGDSTHYWVPTGNFDNDLIIRSDKGRYLFPYDYNAETGFSVDDAPIYYFGKVTTLKSQPDADKAIKALAARGVAVDKETAMVLIQGEAPSNYRPMVPVIPILAVFWGVALMGAWQILRGRRPLRKLPY
jgi:hypothetical protein